ncbi:Transglutaminase-like enzyme, putative cysteine protease [Sinosporangium album]|uniref:Transglutaminase-like enzyme, putative cysteine protease n=1 Tax=Sinosporangium album TaxID=504805 RepID=A0A1G7XD91_9ACTN|nr:DUF3488 and transglutaminase-like domain-containing protein [Sinosporangium album]SDG82156.1 Transglutaminase-like enzyme, putative cysteine protease [Sinosporangium album]
MRLALASGAATLAVSFTLYPLFATGAWFWYALGAILTVTALGAGASRFSIPDWAVLPAGLVGLTMYTTAAFSRDQAWLWVFPTFDSVAEVAALWALGFDDIQRYAAPVPASQGIIALTTAGVGLIALLVDLFAARMRLAALAGLPLLALFTVPAAVITEPLAWPSFIIAALGYLVLLLADGRERVNRWGRAVLARRQAGGSDSPATQPHVGALKLSGKRIGFAAIALAVLVPTALPTLSPNPLFGFGVGGGLGRGSNTITIPNPIAGLRGQLELPAKATVLSYTSSDAAPRYLRLWSLDTFNGDEFQMTAPTGRPEDRVGAGGRLPPAPGLSPSVAMRTNELGVEVSPDINRLEFLPLPYNTTSVDIEGDWRADRSTLVVFSTTELAAGQSYRVTTVEPEPTARTLDGAAAPPDDIKTRYLQLPDDLPEEIRELAVRETAGARTPFRKAVELQNWFTRRGGFTYSLATGGHGSSALIDFLMHTRTGYCEQFAVSMAVLSRVLGIPARVAIGYTGGTRVGDRWEVSTRDTHAWPELYFEGVGWLAFEPTPAGSAGQGSARVPAYTRIAEPSDDTERPGDTAAERNSEPDEADPSAAPATRGQGPLDREGTSSSTAVEEEFPVIAWVGVGVGAVALLLLVPAFARVVMRFRRLRAMSVPVAAREDVAVPYGRAVEVRSAGREGAVTRVWAELDDMLYDYGMSREPSESPRALARRLSEGNAFGPEAAEAVKRITAAIERLMFARDPGGTAVGAADLKLVRAALAASVGRRRRWRAALLPPSTLRRLGSVGTRLLDVFDRLESLEIRRATARR